MKNFATYLSMFLLGLCISTALNVAELKGDVDGLKTEIQTIRAETVTVHQALRELSAKSPEQVKED